ncbi:Vegetative incompatibility protein HET-E-1 [Lachnellula arida]|uniref:Vegetative incompatibility protein HET-E-1 n=1 Tax=Lachnellula arida TaxID=1316785 RepID=A0A8T9BMJ2_9HELO|nr:Vegetative incompatibility protein HET-E-1 [Lachnellula arida]
MRLLNVESGEIEESRLDDDEVSFEDITGPGTAWKRKRGARKIQYACEQSQRDEWDFLWIDTCCIDKRSNAELSEAINSMYKWYGFLAGSPAAFADSGNIIPFLVKATRQPYSMTNKGLRIELRLDLEHDGSSLAYLALLDCQYENDFTGCIGIILKEASEPSIFSRHSGYGSGMRKVNINEMENGAMSTIYIRKNPRLTESLRRYETCLVQPSDAIEKHGYKIVETRPKNTVWNADSRTLQIWNNHYQSSWAALHFCSAQTELGFVVFFKISEAKDESFVKICLLAAGGMQHQWLVREAKAGFENPKESYRLMKKPNGKQERKSDGKGSELITAKARSTERLNQEVWVLKVDLEVEDVDPVAPSP